MRLAFVIGSGYEKNAQLSAIPSAELDCELLGRRLSEPEAGFRVIALSAERGLSERLEQRLLAQTEPISQVLLFFSGYCVLSADRGAALLLDGDRLGTFSMRRLRTLLEHFCSSCCVIVDAAAVVDAGQSLESVVNAMGEALTGDASGLCALIAARESNAPDSFGGSAFTGLVLMGLDWLSASREPDQSVDLLWLLNGLRADEQLWREIPAVGLFPGAPDFVILPALAAPKAALPEPRSASGPPASEEPDEFDDVTPTLTPKPIETEVETSALPSFAPSAQVADELAAMGEYARAADEYQAALALIEAPAERVSALARLARVCGHLGRTEQATQALTEAAELDPLHTEVLALRAEWAEAAADWSAVLHSTAAWLSVAPGERRALELSARAAEALGDPRSAVAARRKMASLSDGTVDEKTGALLEASRLAESGLGDSVLALSLLNEGLALAPARSELLERAGHLLQAPGRQNELFEHYERALRQSRDPVEIGRLAQKLDSLSQAGGVEPLRAAQALEHLAALKPGELGVCDRLIELYTQATALSRAIEHCQRAARIAATRASTYRTALALFEASGSLDAAWNAASVLDCLGEADINESLLASQHKPEGLLAVRGSLTYSEWQSALLADHFDPHVWDLIEALGPSGVRVGVGFAKHKKRYAEPDPGTLQDPEKSTTMLAKTLGWTARLLGLTPPSLYVLPDLARGLAVGTTEVPSALVSRDLASGLGLNQLAFLWGRQLPHFRNELRALSFFRSPAELLLLLNAALALGDAPGVSVRGLDGDAKRLYAALRRELRGPALERISKLCKAFPVPELQARAERAFSGLELACVRAGLVACGDVGAAAELVRRYPTEGFTHAEDQIGELYAFAISEPYGLLRQRLGIAIAS